MNNFQLNNTSVCLGGQCKWDVVLKKEGSELMVDGFQLVPISNNIPFNKHGDTQYLNKTHSDTLKKFYEDIKENFWSINPSLHPLDSTTYYDPSFVSGLRRADCYSVYKKQFEFLVPLWLEYLKDNEFLRFKFVVWTSRVPDDSTKRVRGITLDEKTVDFYPKKSTTSPFHDDFINYFNNWLTYLNIKDNPGRYQDGDTFPNHGNNRVMNIDVKNTSVSIDGVYVSSGQKSDLVSCDYTIDNLFLYERPNIETDYILSNLFRSHNLIASQLFNLNFCFNIEDICDPYFLSQIMGAKISIDCEVSLCETDSDVVAPLSRKTILSNYEFIQRETYNPYLYLSNVTMDAGVGYNINYEIIYENEVSDNVLDYLQDYTVEEIKDKSKLPQHIIHWGYTDHSSESFNLYNGYEYIYCDSGPNVERKTHPSHKPQYKQTKSLIEYTNGISVPYFNNSYVQGRGDLVWVYPKQILYVGYSGESSADTKVRIRETLLSNDDNSPRGKNYLNINEAANAWGVKTNIDSVVSVCCVYINYTGNLSNFVSGDFNGIAVDEHLFITIDNNNSFTIMTNNLNYLVLNKLMEKINSSEHQEFDNLIDFLNELKNIITQANTGDFYGFVVEIGLGKDDLNNNTYYKLDSKSTYVYRKDGDLSPLMLDDPNNNLNYVYQLNTKDNAIERIIEFDPDTPEIVEQGNGWGLMLKDELSFTIEKPSNNGVLLVDLVKDKLGDIYGISNQTLINYIYKLYYMMFDYDYIMKGDDPWTIYTIKMTLI